MCVGGSMTVFYPNWVFILSTLYLSVFACIITNTRIVCVLSVYYLCIIVYLDVLHSEERIALYLRHICLVFLSISKSAIIHERYAPNTHAIGMQYTDPKYAGRDIAMIPPCGGNSPTPSVLRALPEVGRAGEGYGTPSCEVADKLDAPK